MNTSAARYTLKKSAHVAKDPVALERYARFKAMPENDREKLYRAIDILVRTCEGHGLGPLGALELIEQIGIYLVNREKGNVK